MPPFPDSRPFPLLPIYSQEINFFPVSSWLLEIIWDHLPAGSFLPDLGLWAGEAGVLCLGSKPLWSRQEAEVLWGRQEVWVVVWCRQEVQVFGESRRGEGREQRCTLHVGYSPIQERSPLPYVPG